MSKAKHKKDERLTGLLADAMDVAVPIQILKIADRGGPGPEDWRWIKEKGIPTMDELSEYLLHKGFRAGQSAAVFDACARAIAILAFVPCGVTLFGRTWEAKCQ